MSAATCVQHGARVIKGLKNQDYGLRAFVFADPDGNRVDVVSWFKDRCGWAG